MTARSADYLDLADVLGGTDSYDINLSSSYAILPPGHAGSALPVSAYGSRSEALIQSLIEVDQKLRELQNLHDDGADQMGALQWETTRYAELLKRFPPRPSTSVVPDLASNHTSLLEDPDVRSAYDRILHKLHSYPGDGSSAETRVKGTDLPTAEDIENLRPNSSKRVQGAVWSSNRPLSHPGSSLGLSDAERGRDATNTYGDQLSVTRLSQYVGNSGGPSLRHSGLTDQESSVSGVSGLQKSLGSTGILCPPVPSGGGLLDTSGVSTVIHGPIGVDPFTMISTSQSRSRPHPFTDSRGSSSTHHPPPVRTEDASSTVSGLTASQKERLKEFREQLLRSRKQSFTGDDVQPLAVSSSLTTPNVTPQKAQSGDPRLQHIQPAPNPASEFISSIGQRGARRALDRGTQWSRSHENLTVTRGVQCPSCRGFVSRGVQCELCSSRLDMGQCRKGRRGRMNAIDEFETSPNDKGADRYHSSFGTVGTSPQKGILKHSNSLPQKLGSAAAPPLSTGVGNPYGENAFDDVRARIRRLKEMAVDAGRPQASTAVARSELKTRPASAAAVISDKATSKSHRSAQRHRPRSPVCDRVTVPIPFVAGKSTGPSHALGANLQEFLAALKQQDIGMMELFLGRIAERTTVGSPGPLLVDMAALSKEFSEAVRRLIVDCRARITSLLKSYDDVAVDIGRCDDANERSALEEKKDTIAKSIEKEDMIQRRLTAQYDKLRGMSVKTKCLAAPFLLAEKTQDDVDAALRRVVGSAKRRARSASPDTAEQKRNSRYFSVPLSLLQPTISSHMKASRRSNNIVRFGGGPGSDYAPNSETTQCRIRALNNLKRLHTTLRP